MPMHSAFPLLAPKSKLVLPILIAVTGTVPLACSSENGQSRPDGSSGAEAIPGDDGSAAGGGGATTGGDPDGSPRIPVATGEDLPMTCEWLEADNCWKRMIAAIDSCNPRAAGTFSADGESCSFADGSEMSWPPFENFDDDAGFKGLIRYADQRLEAPDGSTCLEVRGVGWADFAVISGGSAIVYDSLSALSLRVICEDGVSYSTELAGSCDSLASRNLAGGVPGFRSQFTADGEAGSAIFNGAADGFHSVWTCERE